MGRRCVWAATDIGLVRKTNEDSFGLPGCISSGGDREHWQGYLPGNGGWAVIADGMGGHEAGELASKAVVETMERLAERATTEVGIFSILEEANAQIYARIASGAGRPGMGSTIVGVVFNPHQSFVFNIGDSRVYVMRDERLLQLSVDHTLRSHETVSSVRSHALTQSLGGTRSPVPLFPHVKSWRPGPEDLIILGSDGLSDMLPPETILQVVEGEHEQPAMALVNAALAAGGRDNVTAIVIGPDSG